MVHCYQYTPLYYSAIPTNNASKLAWIVVYFGEISSLYSIHPNYKKFDFFDTKFDHSSYLKIYIRYYFFCRGLVY